MPGTVLSGELAGHAPRVRQGNARPAGTPREHPRLSRETAPQPAATPQRQAAAPRIWPRHPADQPGCSADGWVVHSVRRRRRPACVPVTSTCKAYPHTGSWLASGACTRYCLISSRRASGLPLIMTGSGSNTPYAVSACINCIALGVKCRARSPAWRPNARQGMGLALRHDIGRLAADRLGEVHGLGAVPERYPVIDAVREIASAAPEGRTPRTPRRQMPATGQSTGTRRS